MIAILLLVAAACSGSDDGDQGGTTSSPTSTSSSSTAATATTATSSSTTTGSTETSPTSPTSASTNERAEGSGCTPPSGDSLPDGRWYGLIDAASPTGIDFDLACFFTGDAAVAAAAEDGEESPPPNDYHVRNVNDLLRAFEVDLDTPVTWYPDGGSPTDVVTVDYEQWLTDREARAFDLAVWITTAAGRVVEIEEQWVP